MKTIYVKPEKYERKWFIIDAKGKTLGKVATKAAVILRGKNKPEYAPLHDLGDFVVIINADKVVLTGKKADTKEYFRHSMYPGGLTRESYKDMLKRKPCFPLEEAVRGMLPKNALGRKMFLKLKVYQNAEHPHEAQKPIAVEI